MINIPFKNKSEIHICEKFISTDTFVTNVRRKSFVKLKWKGQMLRNKTNMNYLFEEKTVYILFIWIREFDSQIL